MKNKYSKIINGLVEQIEPLVSRDHRSVIVIDGRAASGKSTLADLIAERIGGSVIRADHFFLPVELRTPERLSTPGGNFHFERFKEEVLSSLDGEFEYGVFNCSEGRVTEKKLICGGRPVVIEGAYSASPAFGRYYDMLIFVTASYDTRIKRITSRNGAEKAEIFKKRWIPMEESYLDAFDIESLADITIDTTDV